VVSQTLPRDTLMPRTPGGTRRGIGLSVLVHLGLLVAIAFGVNWRSRTPEAQQAELWAAVPQAVAPRAAEPEPVPAPRSVQPPPPVAKPALPTMAPPPAPAPVPVPDAQIAIEKARVEKARKEQEAAERARELEREREAQRRKLEAQKLAADKAAADKAAAEKVAADKLAAEKMRQQQQQQAEKQKALDAQKEAERKKQQATDEARQTQQIEAERKKNLERIRGLAGASGEPAATGSALQSAGPSASYAGRIKARVKPNIVFADEVAGNPTAEVEVRAAPDGTILGRKLVKSSGVPAYDNAVLRAIDKTELLPRDVDGRVPASLLLVFRVHD
jgi:colicin import membrane protein